MKVISSSDRSDSSWALNPIAHRSVLGCLESMIRCTRFTSPDTAMSIVVILWNMSCNSKASRDSAAPFKSGNKSTGSQWSSTPAPFKPENQFVECPTQLAIRPASLIARSGSSLQSKSRYKQSMMADFAVSASSLPPFHAGNWNTLS